MVRSGISGAVRDKGTDGPDGPETWEHAGSQERKGVYHFSIFNFD